MSEAISAAQLGPDRGEAERFIATLAGSADAEVTFQTYPDPDELKDERKLCRILHGTLANHWAELARLNARGAGVFVMVNVGDGSGRRKENVRSLRALFADDDSGTLTPTALELTPSLIVQSKRGIQPYWRLRPGAALVGFTPAQKALASALQTDASVHDLPRVMRVPGFLHQKNRAEPFLVRVLQTSDVAYSIDEVLGAYRAAPQPPQRPAPFRVAGNVSGYAAGALRSAGSVVRNAMEGERNETLNDQAFSLGQLVAGGVIARGEAEAELETAALDAGLTHGEARATIRSGLNAGAKSPRAAPERRTGARGPLGEEPPPPESEHLVGAGRRETAPEPWPDPLPLEQRPQLPAFPLEVLPAWLDRIVRAIATETETDPTMTAMWTLTAVAIACGKRFVIERGPRRCVHANLWSLILLGSGGGKSPSLRAAHEPLATWEQRRELELRDRIAAEGNEERILRGRLAHLQHKAARGKSEEERKQAQYDAKEVALRLDGLQRTVAPVLSVQSATVARLQELLFEQGRFALVSDEASALEDLVRFERSGTPDLSSLNQAYDGADIRVARKKREDGTGGDRFARRAVLTLALSIQPGRALDELRGSRAFFDSGFLQRMIVIFPEDRLGLRTHDQPAIPEAVRAEYSAHLGELLDLPAVRDDVDFPTVQLAPAASRLLFEWQQSTETNWKKGEEDTLRGWGSKLGDKLVRVAGLLHAAEHRRAPWASQLSADTMSRSLSLADFFLAHYRAFLFDARVDPVSALALRAAAWIRKARLATFKRSELHMAIAKNGGAGTAELLDKALKLLESVSYIRRAAPVPGRGRTPDLYDVNPKVHDAD